MAWVEEFVVGLVAGAGAAYLVLWLLRALRSSEGRTVLSEEPPLASPTGDPDPPPPFPVGIEAGPFSNPVPPPTGTELWPGLPRPSVVAGPTPGRVPSAYGPHAEEPVRLSRRVVLQLFRQGRLDPDDVATIERTQGGLGSALAAEQSAVSKVLRRLVAAGIVEVSRRHVRGEARRMNVYSLTRRGERLAYELRASGLPRPGAPNAGDPEPYRPPALVPGR